MASEVEDLRDRLTAAGLGDPDWSEEDGLRIDSPSAGSILSPNVEAGIPCHAEGGKLQQEACSELKERTDGFRNTTSRQPPRGEDTDEEDCDGGIPIGARTKEGGEEGGTLGSTPPSRGPGPGSEPGAAACE